MKNTLKWTVDYTLEKKLVHQYFFHYYFWKWTILCLFVSGVVSWVLPFSTAPLVGLSVLILATYGVYLRYCVMRYPSKGYTADYRGEFSDDGFTITVGGTDSKNYHYRSIDKMVVQYGILVLLTKDGGFIIPDSVFQTQREKRLFYDAVHIHINGRFYGQKKTKNIKLLRHIMTIVCVAAYGVFFCLLYLLEHKSLIFCIDQFDTAFFACIWVFVLFGLVSVRIGMIDDPCKALVNRLIWFFIVPPTFLVMLLMSDSYYGIEYAHLNSSDENMNVLVKVYLHPMDESSFERNYSVYESVAPYVYDQNRPYLSKSSSEAVKVRWEKDRAYFRLGDDGEDVEVIFEQTGDLNLK